MKCKKSIKTVLAWALCLCMALSLLPHMAYAADPDREGSLQWDATNVWGYKVIGDKVWLENYAGSASDITVPETLSSLPVAKVTLHLLGKYNAKTLRYDPCKTVKNVTFPATITEIELRFAELGTGLQNITIADGHPSYSSIDGVMFSKDKTKLLIYPQGRTETAYTVPSSVTTIADAAFNGCSEYLVVTASAGLKDELTKCLPCCVTNGGQISCRSKHYYTNSTWIAPGMVEYTCEVCGKYITETRTLEEPIWDDTTAYSVEMGKTLKLNPFCISGATINFESLNKGVATVSADGTVTPVSEGEAKIRMYVAAHQAYDASEKTVTVTVTKASTLAAPVVTDFTYTFCQSATLTWKKVDGASCYKLFTSSAGIPAQKVDGSTLKGTIASPEPCSKVWVVAYKEDGTAGTPSTEYVMHSWSKWTDDGAGKEKRNCRACGVVETKNVPVKTLDAPVIVSLKADSTGQNGTVTFNKVKNAEYYYVYSGKKGNASKKEKVKDTGASPLTTVIALPERCTAVWVVAYSDAMGVESQPSDYLYYTDAQMKLSKSTYVYDGTYKKPTVTVTSRGLKLTSGTDYTVSYSKNKAIGKATVTVKFCGDYIGDDLTKTFKINPPATSISKLSKSKTTLTVKWTRQSSVTGYELQYAKNSKFTSPSKVTITKNATVSKKLTKLTKGKKYYVRIRTYKTVNGTKYYSTWSATKNISM